MQVALDESQLIDSNVQSAAKNEDFGSQLF